MKQTSLLISRAEEGTAEFIELWSHSEAIVVGMTHSTFQRYSEILTLVLPESIFGSDEAYQMLPGINVTMATYPR